MTCKILIVPVLLSVMTLPSCMQPVDNVLKARSEARLSHLEAIPVTQGACDSIGRPIAKSVEAERVAARNAEPKDTFLVVQ